MSKLSIYQVDAFTDQLFGGNPAAICPLDHWLPDTLMQQIALENNLSETAFFVPVGEKYEIRWFTPTVEVDLCGHATLAAAFVLFHQLGYAGKSIEFHSPRSGPLTVQRQGDWLLLNFPKDEWEEIATTPDIEACLEPAILQTIKGKTDFMLVLESEEDVKALRPNLARIANLPARGIIVTARGSDVDFVSRFFGPAAGVDEDPVTGSAHTTLIPYWAEQLQKKNLTARQVSARGGYLQCRLLDDRVEIGGKGRLYLVGEINIA